MNKELKFIATAEGFDKVKAATDNVAKGLANTAVASQKFDSSLQKASIASNQATNSLTNLGRVVQDAPYGFIGIANNINPLLESFQRLKAEIGSNGSAFKSLAASLAGAGGLGLAVSAVTSLLVVFSMQSNNAANETKKLKDNVDLVAEAAKRAGADIEDLGRSIDFATQFFGNFAQLNLGSGFATNLTIAKQASVALAQEIDILTQKRDELQAKQFIAIDKLQFDKAGQLSAQVSEYNKKLDLLIDKQRLAQQNVRLVVQRESERNKKSIDDIDELTKVVTKAADISTDALAKLKATFPEGIAGILIPEPPSNNLPWLRDWTDAINEFFQNSAIDIGVNFADTLGKAIAGEANVGDFFKSIFASLGQSIKQLGKYFLANSVIIKRIKDTIIKNPAVAIAASLALIALGSLIQAGASKQGFATGTRNAPGGLALVGERGPELLSLPKGSRVTPANQTANIIGGGFSGLVIAETRVSGQDLLLTIKRASGSYSRTT